MAETVYIRGEGGVVWAMDLPLPEGIAQRLQLGTVTQVNADGSPLSEHPASAPVSEPSERPADSAKKDAWVAWAVACGADEAEAERLTKPQLIEQFGGREPSGED